MHDLPTEWKTFKEGPLISAPSKLLTDKNLPRYFLVGVDWKLGSFSMTKSVKNYKCATQMKKISPRLIILASKTKCSVRPNCENGRGSKFVPSAVDSWPFFLEWSSGMAVAGVGEFTRRVLICRLLKCPVRVVPHGLGNEAGILELVPQRLDSLQVDDVNGDVGVLVWSSDL